MRRRRSWWVGAALAVAARPGLWGTALHEASVTVGPRWWADRPPLPRPPKEWMAFRMETAYGDPAARPPPEDVIAWLEWCKAGPSLARSARVERPARSARHGGGGSHR